ncbi:hypothetical protein [Mumia zhuanghuii]|nr:hypothetical protein [Mumia zhuanghuii]
MRGVVRVVKGRTQPPLTPDSCCDAMPLLGVVGRRDMVPLAGP